MRADVGFHLSFFTDNGAPVNGVRVFLNDEDIFGAFAVNINDGRTFSRPTIPGVKNRLRIVAPTQLDYALTINSESHVSKIDGKIRSSLWLENRQVSDTTYELVMVDQGVVDGQAAMPLGVATPLQIEDLSWTMGLGRLRSGNTAGYLQYLQEDLVTNSYKRSALALQIPESNDGELVVHYTDNNSDGVRESVRQIKTPQGLVDITDDSDGVGFTVSVYSGGIGGNSSTLYAPVGVPLVTYRFDRPAINRLTLRQSDQANQVITYTVQKTVDGGFSDWTLTSSGTGISKSLSVDNQLVSGRRQEARSLSYATTPAGSIAEATKSFEIRDTYVQIPPFESLEVEERLYQRKVNQGDSELERTDNYRYYDADVGPLDSGLAQFGGLKSFKSHFGNWGFYEYHIPNLAATSFISGTSFDRQEYDVLSWFLADGNFQAYHGANLFGGKPWMVFGPEGDGFQNFNVEGDSRQLTVPTANGETTKTELLYGQDWMRTPGQIRSAKTTWSKSGVEHEIGANVNRYYTFPYRANDPNGKHVQVAYHAYTDGESPSGNDFEDANATLYMARYRTHEDASNFNHNLNKKPYYTVNRNNTKTSFGYKAVGSFQGVNNAWVELSVSGQGAELPSRTYTVDLPSGGNGTPFQDLEVNNALWRRSV